MKKYYFAPGVIESFRKERAPVDTFARFLLSLACMFAFGWCLGAAAGWVEWVFFWGVAN
ncbi:hypothetical protein [Comamonas koreensis]|uniref:Uncharacterized protein n=1 Tax=Comamonas koreensis TaxID=160825 RepID=A0AAW4XTE7_9BURK|nr:hypothetical protein [Comamonas koreensis]MCD2164681.1 hypothetical protein [Comamonas koreensis]